MTPDEILKGLYDETLVGNAPVVREGVEKGLEDGLEPERMLYDALVLGTRDYARRCGFGRASWCSTRSSRARGRRRC
mgnify:CR=1 FL=1